MSSGVYRRALLVALCTLSLLVSVLLLVAFAVQPASAKAASAKCKIVYDLGGGTNNASNPKTIAAGDQVSLRYPTRAGYVFAGWYFDTRCSLSAATVKATAGGRIVVHAKWVSATPSFPKWLTRDPKPARTSVVAPLEGDVLRYCCPQSMAFAKVGGAEYLFVCWGCQGAAVRADDTQVVDGSPYEIYWAISVYAYDVATGKIGSMTDWHEYSGLQNHCNGAGIYGRTLYVENGERVELCPIGEGGTVSWSGNALTFDKKFRSLFIKGPRLYLHTRDNMYRAKGKLALEDPYVDGYKKDRLLSRGISGIGADMNQDGTYSVRRASFFNLTWQDGKAGIQQFCWPAGSESPYAFSFSLPTDGVVHEPEGLSEDSHGNLMMLVNDWDGGGTLYRLE